MARSRSGSAGSGRVLTDGKRRKPSSRRWLERQMRDPYVIEARRQGYRSRAAFKLKELDDRFRFLRPGARVVDLGAAPGGWTQFAVERVRPGQRAGGCIIAVDQAEFDPVSGAHIIQGDARSEEILENVKTLLGAAADVVLSDMAPSAIGHRGADHLRIVALAEAAVDIAETLLAPGGTFVCKVWQGGMDSDLLARLKRSFSTVRHAKPAASRTESPEVFVVAQGFRRPKSQD
ncbi:MAG: RlmE family RNA methyltransferase [Hyphomicrobiales bacterium]|nr:RlmE family RNA methyltransferase [Hyphomicrobiales bacterium]